jgi:2-C-methyl-D-erythritol 4-phosphate cytidylyltransferase
MKTNMIVLLLLVALFLCPMPLVAADDARLQAAVGAATKWLALVDGGKYAESWSALSSSLKKSKTQDDWVATMKADRAQLGKVISRTLLEKTTRDKGVILKYRVSYEKLKNGNEQVWLYPEKDGAWRVTSYYPPAGM